MNGSVVTEIACIGLANQMILEFQLPIPRIQHLSEIASTTFVSLFQALCGYLPNGVVEYPQTVEDDVRNVDIIIETLSRTFLHLPLTHIKGKNVLEMDPVSIYNLLEIFQAYAKHASVPEQSESSSSPTTTSSSATGVNGEVSQIASSPNSVTWSSCLSENRSSSISPTSNVYPEADQTRTHSSGKRIHSPRFIVKTRVSTAGHPSHSVNQTCESKNKSSSKKDLFHHPVKNVARICHVCDTEHFPCTGSPASTSDGDSICERCKRLFQGPTELGWLRHHVKSPFKKMRVSEEEFGDKKGYSKYRDLDSKLKTSSQKANYCVPGTNQKFLKTTAARNSPPHRSLETYICGNCKASMSKHGKENYIMHRFSETTAPPLPKQRHSGSSVLDDSSLCANCKLSLSKENTQKLHYSDKSVMSPLRNGPSCRLDHFHDGNYSVLHECPKTHKAPIVKTYVPEASPEFRRRHGFTTHSHRTSPGSITEPALQAEQESPRGRWTSYSVKKNWSYPDGSFAKTYRPKENSYSSSSPDLHSETKYQTKNLYHMLPRSHSQDRSKHMNRSPILDAESSLETDEGPIKLRFHGSSKQVTFGRNRDNALLRQRPRTSAKAFDHYISPRECYRNNSLAVRKENNSSQRKYPSKPGPRTKRIISSTAKRMPLSPTDFRYQTKSPGPRETVIIHHHERNKHTRQPENKGKQSELDDKFARSSVQLSHAATRKRVTRQRAGSSRSLAWQEGFVKCAATYGFQVPRMGSSESPSSDVEDPNMSGNIEKPRQQDLLQYLQQEFPHLAVPTSSIENLRNRYLKDMKRMASLYLNGYASKTASLDSYNLLKRQLELQNLMSKDLAASQRKNDIQVQQYRWRKMQRMGCDQRIQSVQIKKIYENYHLAERSKMLRRRTKEEMLFRDLYEEGVAALHEKLREIKRHVKDDLTQFKNEHQGKLEALHNYYNSQLDLLAETVSSQKHNLEDQELILKRLQREFRQKLRECLTAAQEQIFQQDEEDFHFREQDKNRVKTAFYKS